MTPINDILAAFWRTLAAVRGHPVQPDPTVPPCDRPGDVHSRKVDPEYRRITAELREIQQWQTCVRRSCVLPNRATSDPLAANLLIAATGNGTVRIVEEETA